MRHRKKGVALDVTAPRSPAALDYPHSRRPPDQPLAPAGDGGRSPEAGDCRPDFAAPRGAAAKKGDLKPHQIRYWLTPPPTEPVDERNEKIADICTLYQEAPARAATGERILSSDEMTGVQALERKYPGLPLRPGKVERREVQYIRHRTPALIPNLAHGRGAPV